MRANLQSEPPITYRVAPSAAEAELDYADMIALSGMFRRWAIYEANVTPEQRTRLIEYSADFERLAAWTGQDWRASNPSPRPTLLKFLATAEQKNSNVIDFQGASRALGLLKKSM